MNASSGRLETLGRYVLCEEIATGGMASVHLARLVGDVGFGRTVAIKRLHPQFARDENFVAMFVDEARLASRIRHANVAATLDVVQTAKELFVVMEYIHGETLSQLLRPIRAKGERVPPPIVFAILVGMLNGLHAAHDATSELGEPLEIVHRDVSPQNAMVGADGSVRIMDFGIAKASKRHYETTSEGQIKGKLAYMAPEQLSTEKVVDRRTDIFAAGIVGWELLTGQRLFGGEEPAATVAAVLTKVIPAPSSLIDVPEGTDEVLMKALERAPNDRYATAEDMATVLEKRLPVASARELREWIKSVAGERLAKKAKMMARAEALAADAPSGTVVTSVTNLPASGPLAKRDDADELETSADMLSSGTKLSAISNVERPSERSKGRLALASIAFGICAAAIGTWIGVSGRNQAAPAVARDDRQLQSSTAAAPQPILGSSLLTPPSSLPAPSTLPPPSATTTASSSSAAGDHSTTTSRDAPRAHDAPRGTQVPRTVHSAAQATKPAAPNCNPPYIITASGDRRFKPECVE